ncbi:MOSC domain-containing protein [Rhizobium alvei]|uniref:MOSC domain-containing protein n=1 Tax=Rhizobium alvei TaxID=1132659 RepID=A0ABT8YGF2_9HYPH|nr:MOSC domain-containing protein [Rhizobium alvei]MDO6962364.1 MOSC domain-containing protein [Rhizobium alvei]
MKLVAVCIGEARPTPSRKSARTGIFKQPVTASVMVDREGIVGDKILNRKHHGGPEQAIYIESAEDLAWWEAELGIPVAPGTFGENLVISGIANRDLAVGDRFEIGDVLLEITSARVPCATFALRMGDPQFVKRYTKAARPGAYARVLKSGTLSAGDTVQYTAYAGVRLTMPELLRTFGRKLTGEERAQYLSTPINSRIRDLLES